MHWRSMSAQRQSETPSRSADHVLSKSVGISQQIAPLWRKSCNASQLRLRPQGPGEMHRTARCLLLSKDGRIDYIYCISRK